MISVIFLVRYIDILFKCYIVYKTFPHLLQWRYIDVPNNNLPLNRVISNLVSNTKFRLCRFSPSIVSGGFFPPFVFFLRFSIGQLFSTIRSLNWRMAQCLRFGGLKIMWYSSLLHNFLSGATKSQCICNLVPIFGMVAVISNSRPHWYYQFIPKSEFG